MEIPVLQSLIKRTSREITRREVIVMDALASRVYPPRYIQRIVNSNKAKIKKLAKIQKALKDDMAKALSKVRYARCVSYWRNRG